MKRITTTLSIGRLMLSVATAVLLLHAGNVGAQLADSPWPMYRGNLQHTGLSPYHTGHVEGWVKWSHEPDPDNDSWAESSPVIGPDGTIYYAVHDLTDQNGKLYAVNPDGSAKWEQAFATGQGVNSWGMWKSIQATPAIAADGTIYLVALDDKVYAINPDGTPKWASPFDIDVNEDIWSSPAIGADGTIYVGSHDGFAGKLYAITPDKTVKWRFTTGSDVSSSPAISPDGTTIYVGSGDGHLYAIDTNGHDIWRFNVRPNETDGWFVESSPAVGPDGTIYVGAGFLTDTGVWQGRLFAIDANGNELWRFPETGTLSSEVWSSPAIGPDGTIYVGTGDGTDNNLYAIYPNGREKWQFPTGDQVASSPVVGADGTIYVGSIDHNLYAINPDNGEEKWHLTIPCCGWVSSVAIGADGTVYAANDKLYALSTRYGLMAYYPFNGNALDASGNGNHGVVSGATLTMDRFGSANGAYSFDGVDDGIIVSDDNTLDMTDAITIAAWINPRTSALIQPVVVKRNLTSDFAYYLDIAPGTVRGMFRVDDGSMYGLNRPQWGLTGIIADVWQHIAVTYDGSAISVYYNGQPDYTYDFGSSLPILASSGGLEIGHYSIGRGVFYDGTIDEVRIYERVLSASEIQRLYIDPDGDGIESPIDTRPSVYSNDFSDGTTTGTITTRGDQILTIADAPNPEGVEITTASGGGSTPATITGCGGEVKIETVGAGGYALFTCENSFTLEVVSGLFDLNFVIAGDITTVSLSAGNGLRADPSTGTLTALSGNADTINVFIGEYVICLAPGDVKTVVSIDIRPFSRHNVIGPRKWGLVPVAILSTSEFDAPYEVDRKSLTFGATGDEQSRAFCLRRGKDVNRDGFRDLIAFFRTKKTGFQVGDEVGILKGYTTDGLPIEGSDWVTVKKKWSHWRRR